jgi:hypothetical protein
LSVLLELLFTALGVVALLYAAAFVGWLLHVWECLTGRP